MWQEGSTGSKYCGVSPGAWENFYQAMSSMQALNRDNGHFSISWTGAPVSNRIKGAMKVSGIGPVSPLRFLARSNSAFPSSS
jgi:hypothetical protein